MSPVVISTFICRTIGETPYLVADFTLQCNTAAWKLAATWASIWTVVYLVGFPLLLCWGLRRRADALAFVAEPYKDDGGIVRFWEVVEFAKKFFLSSALLAFPEHASTRISLAVVATAIVQVAFVWHKPYKSSVHNQLELAVSSALLLTYYIGLMLKVQPDASQQQAYAVILILLIAGVVIAGAWAFYWLRAEAIRAVRDAAGDGSSKIEVEFVEFKTPNPAYSGFVDAEAEASSVAAGDGGSGKSADTDDSADAATSAAVAALQAELERVKRTRAEYVSSRVSTEVQKVQQQLQKLQKQHFKEQQQKHAAELAERQQAEAQLRAEQEQLRAELEQLKAKSE